VGSKIRDLVFVPLYVAGWAIVAGAVVVRSLAKRDKPRQKTTGEDPLPSYIKGVTRREHGSQVHDCPRHG
jgi:hypothetical protein